MLGPLTRDRTVFWYAWYYWASLVLLFCDAVYRNLHTPGHYGEICAYVMDVLCARDEALFSAL